MIRCDAWPDCSCGYREIAQAEYALAESLRRERIRERVNNRHTGNVMTDIDLRLRWQAAKARKNRAMKKMIELGYPPKHSDLQRWKLQSLYNRHPEWFPGRRVVNGELRYE